MTKRSCGSATSKGEWLHESKNKTATWAARGCEMPGGKASRESSRPTPTLQQEWYGIRRGEWRAGAKALRAVAQEYWGLFCGCDRNREMMPFPSITAAGKRTEVRRQSLLGLCHHRSSAESSHNPSRCLFWGTATCVQLLILHSDVMHGRGDVPGPSRAARIGARSGPLFLLPAWPC